MEPMNCTARVDEGRCEVWAPSQSPSLVQLIAAGVAEVDTEQVTVHTTFLGGGFGRRAEMDFVAQAVTVAKELEGRPVKLLWSREEDIQHDAYRPAAISRFRAGLDGKGRALALWNRIAGPSVSQSFMGRLPWLTLDMPDKTNVEGAADMPYDFPHLRVEHVLSETPVPVGFWRSVGHSYNAFFVECFMDELAAAAGQDPYQFRRSLLATRPRHLKVLDTAASKAGWGTPSDPGVGRGIALHESFRSIVAQVAEVSVSPAGAIEVHRVVCAIDCGMTVNPDIVAAQMESGIIFGLSAALYGEITLADGRVEQRNFPSYDMIRLAQAPVIETHILESGAALGGVGEPGTPPIAPALANAVFAARGIRIRRLPIRPDDLANG
jgi:isoquinoline 1-oxidoreductase beta subunit